MLELLALLLPIAAASGWYAARQHFTKKYLLNQAQPLRRAYCRGLNYLLNEKTDKAIDVFADILERDCETIETHIALGNLFRRRGDVDKAIDVHEKLVQDRDLTEELRNQAYFELGLDYMRAGLFDRAETVFSTLVYIDSHRQPSLKQLLEIYQHEKDWDKAIECTRLLTVLCCRPPRGESVAHFLCEIAEEAVLAGQRSRAKDCLKQALREDPSCARASLLRAKLEISEKDFHEALNTLKKVELQQSAYLSEILEPLQICYESLGNKQELMAYLQDLYGRYALVAATVRVTQQIHERNGLADAIEYMLKILEEKPNLTGLNHVIGLLAHAAEAADLRLALDRTYQITGCLLSWKPQYVCTQCGFSGLDLHWRCPSCRYWGSIKPV
ncbi:lipopolysaccharide assembly protein LapB [Methylocaldum sp.]|uniref:lipopolysaccharide assembly protein LapB n=1 Tax=Methylocaldum sp. TaxID=1969727 RepID=UPI002D303F71|nr:lipopolysaccharide assembly protein LapB [Methylocaldum sp.]HYE34538.1 lipopolysaccharide assembly protein LapB [Methylocaldum sp.]